MAMRTECAAGAPSPARSRSTMATPSAMCGSRRPLRQILRRDHTVGFDKWKAYLVGEEDGIASAGVQEEETGVPARDVRALAREMGQEKRVYLAPGGWGNGHGGACRNQTGIQWARVIGVPLGDAGARQARREHGQSAMGLSASISISIPGLRRRRHVGRSREHRHAVALYQRMPQLPTMNTNGQTIPRIWLPEAIVDGKAEGYRWVGKSIEHQFAKFAYRRRAIRR